MIRSAHINKHLFLFIILHALSGSFIFSEDKIDEEINKIPVYEKFENIKAADDKKELHKKIENSNKDNIKNDDIDILTIKDEITGKQLLAFLNIIKETASPEVYQQQKEALLKAIKEHEKLSSLLKEKNNLPVNKNDSSSPEERFFIPQEPIKLSSDAKKIDCTERIKNKFIGEIPEQVQKIINHLDDYQAQKNLPVPNLILLHGQTGTGKTTLIKSIAQELEVALMYIPASILINDGDQKYISKFFASAQTYVLKHNKPIILFIDKIDIVAPKNNPPQFYEYLALRRLLFELKNLYDDKNKNIFTIVTTNDLQNLDPRIKSRFEDLISISEIKDLDRWEKAAYIRNIFKEYGKNIDKYCSEVLSNKLSELGNTISHRGIRNLIRAAIADKEQDCELHDENCNLHEFYYIWKELGKREGWFLKSFNVIAPYNPVLYLMGFFEKCLNSIKEHSHQEHVIKDLLGGCSQCFYNKVGEKE